MSARRDMSKKRRDKGKYLISKTVDVGIATFCSAMLLYHILVCLERYMSKQTKVMSELKPSHLEVFPSCTFCPAYLNFSYKADILKKYNTSRSEFVDRGNFVNNGTTSPKDLYVEATHEIHEIISRITIESLATKLTNGEIFTTKPPEKSSFLSWKTVYTQSLGRCYEMQIDSSKIDSPIIAISVDAKTAFFVYLHYPGQFGYINSVAKVPVERNERVFVDVSYELNDNRRALKNCNPNSDLNFNECLDRKVHQSLMEDFQCSVPFLQSSDVFCMSSNASFNALVIKNFLIYSKLKQIILCGSPCKSLDIYSGMPHRSHHSDPHKSFVKLYIQTTIRVKTSIVDYSGINMLAEIGGSYGLLLGLPLIQIGVRVKTWLLGY